MAFTLVRQLVGHGGYLVDLRAFYCGGWSVLHRADPYTTIATACVNAIEPGAAVLRAPHPPFALAAYALMALLPFKVVGISYIVLAWLAVGATAAVLANFVPIKSWIIALGMAPLLGYFCISFGQPQPFIALCIVSCAYFLICGRYVAAAICAALTLVFPQFGLPLIATVFVCRPKTRVALASSVGVLAAIGLIALGPAANAHYVTVSLRLEQLQTAGDSLQYSLPWLLQQFGLQPVPSAIIGLVWYVTVFAAGLVFLLQLKSHRAVPLTALLPPALVPLSSTFVHPQHFALALPLAIFVLSASLRYLMPVVFGAALLVVPWMYCIVAGSIAHELPRVAILFALGIAFAGGFLQWPGRKGQIAPGQPLPALAIIFGLYVLIGIAIHASLGWIPSVDEPPNDLATLGFKVPSLLGLIDVLVYGLLVPARDDAIATITKAARA